MNCWINTIKDEIKKIRNSLKKCPTTYEVKYTKKKILKDLWNLPKISQHYNCINFEAQINEESNFKEKNKQKIDK